VSWHHHLFVKNVIMNVNFALAVFCLCLARGFATVKWQYGNETAIADDALSVATCPEGFYVSECICENQSTCDGSQFDSEDTRKCNAYHKSFETVATRALAKCIQPPVPKSIKIVSENLYSRRSIKCPEGYTMESCSLLDHWSTDRTLYMVRSPTSCSHISTASFFRWVHVSMVCTKKMTEEDFIY